MLSSFSKQNERLLYAVFFFKASNWKKIISLQIVYNLLIRSSSHMYNNIYI